MAQKAKCETIRTTAFGSITGSYVAVGSAFANPIRIICLTNTTDKAMLFSFDGVNDHLVVPNGSFKLLDLTTNKLSTDSILAISANTKIYVKYVAAPGSGSVYVEAMYGE